MPDQRDPKNDSVWQMLGQYSEIAFILPTSIAVGFGIGYLLDGHFHTGKVFQIVLILLGMIAGFVRVYRIAMRK